MIQPAPFTKTGAKLGQVVGRVHVNKEYFDPEKEEIPGAGYSLPDLARYFLKRRRQGRTFLP